MREAASGMSEIMLEAGAMTGVLFLIGIAINNWRHAVLAFAGSIVGTILAHYHHDPEKSIMIGIYGYNAALTAIAVFLWRPSLIAALLGAALTVPLIEYFPGVVSPLTAPFVIASWIVLFIGIVIEPRFGPSPIAGR
jgi:urea transporter